MMAQRLHSKILPDTATAAKVIERHKMLGLEIVFTNGCFDCLHPGHVYGLTQASSFGDILVVGVNSDRSVSELKGAGRPIIKQKDRLLMLASLEVVDYLIVFDENDPSLLINALVPDVLAKGGDYQIEGVVGREVVENAGGKIVILPLLEGYSTTSLIKEVFRSHK